MPASPANAKNMLLSSDYPVDKIIYVKEGSFTMTGSSAGTESFAHNLPDTPLIQGYWSTSSDFSLNYTFASGPFPSSTNAHLFDRCVEFVYADSTNINLPWYSDNATSTTIYYRVYAFAKPGSSDSYDHVAIEGDDFVLNTDYNYMKLKEDGNALPGAVSTYTVSHDLGYKPMAFGWWENSLGWIYPVLTQDYTYLLVSSTNISFNVNFGNMGSLTNVYWRIYYDE